MEAEKIFFERYHGISSLLAKGMPSDVLFEGKSFNIEANRDRYIPYSCRCEAIGGGRDKGLLYRGLDGSWEIIQKDKATACRRNFKLPPEWKGYRLYLVIDDISPKTTVYINGALACFCFDDEKRPYIESEITAHINFDLKNEIVIISEEIESESLCRASIIARKFVHIRDFDCEINDSEVSVNVSMSKSVPAKVLAEVYDDELNLIASGESEVCGEGNIKCDVSVPVRLVLLVCGTEVIPVASESHKRPDLPAGEAVSEYLTGSCREFLVETVSLQNGVFKIIHEGDCEAAELEYCVFSESGVLYSGQKELNFTEENRGVCIVNIEYDIPSLSFYEYFIDFKVNGEFAGQFKFPVKQTACERILSSDMPAFYSLDIGNGKVAAIGVNFENVFDTEKGIIERISKEGCDVIREGFLISCGGLYAEHIRSTVVSRDNHYVGISSVYSIKSNSSEISVSVLTILYGDGEIGVSVSGFAENLSELLSDGLIVTYKLSDRLLSTKVYGDIDLSPLVKTGVYDCNSYSGDTFVACRWIYSYGERVPGLFVKGMPQIDAKISGSVRTRDLSPGISLFIKPDRSGMLAASFVLKPVFCENEDIIREARTIPFVAQ